MNVRSTVASSAKTTLKASALVIDRLRTPIRGITILIYHRVGAGAGGEMDLDPAVFEAQLAWLTNQREVISLDEAINRLQEPSSLGGSEVVLTFDDGTADWLTEVLPALERHSTPATFYVATSFLDSGMDVPSLSSTALSELASSDLVTIGSHTHGHMLLDRLPPERLADELDRSIDIIGELTGSAPKHFAYPKAVAGSPAAEEAVRQRFDSAVIAGTRANPAGTDTHLLHRSPIQASDRRRWFEAKAKGGLRAEDDVRQLANKLRYRRMES